LLDLHVNARVCLSRLLFCSEMRSFSVFVYLFVGQEIRQSSFSW